MEPKKKIILYHLGKINAPIADFDANADVAKLCVDLLNRHLLTSNGQSFSILSVKILKRQPFYYLRGEDNSDRAFYVGIHGLKNINDDPDFKKRILELAGDHEEHPGDIEKPTKNPLPGGRKNKENRKKPL